jgi:hypothetical protein
MQVSLMPHKHNGHSIAAMIMVVGGVEWLVDIPNGMNEIY